MMAQLAARGLLSLLAVMAMTVADARAGEVTMISPESRESYVAAYAGTVAWSSYDPASRQYRIVAWQHGHRHKLNLRPGRAPFELDLGPDIHGRVSLVYSRCRRVSTSSPFPGPRGSGCEIWQYDFATKHERRRTGLGPKGADQYLPTLWRDTIAFVRRNRSIARGKPQIFVRRDQHRARRIRGGPVGRYEGDGSGGPGPTRLDLRGRKLAFTWEFVTKGGGCLIDPRSVTPRCTNCGSERRAAPQGRLPRGATLMRSQGSDRRAWMLVSS